MGGVSGDFAGDSRCHLHCGKGQVADDNYKAAKKGGRRSKKNSRLLGGLASSGEAPRNARTSISKDLASIAEENVEINTIVSTERDVGGVRETGPDSNLVDVRVAQADYLVQQWEVRPTSTLLSDSAIENCNRIYRLKNDESEAVRVWKAGKDMGYTRYAQEDVIISRIQSLEVRDNSNLRFEGGGELSVNVDEDN